MILFWFVGSLALLVWGLLQMMWGLLRMGFYLGLLILLGVAYAFVLLAAVVETILHRRQTA